MLIIPPVISSAATVAVDKATSELLSAPDWSLNINICDSLNSNKWKTKDIVKAVKRRLQYKNSRVQLLTLTLLETMVKNCGNYVHYQIDERDILDEMVKLVKRKADIRVRDKILTLLDSWQEAFGGRNGEHPQYYWAYQELRRSGISFPERSPNAVPILTPPAKHLPRYGMPSNSSRRLDETVPKDIESLSLSSLDSIKDVMDLLGDMLQAVNHRDPTAMKDEVIADIVNQCRSNQKKLMQTLTTTRDELLLARGLELNDGLQSLLAKHDAISSSSPLAIQVTTTTTRVTSKPIEEKSNEVKNSSPTFNISPPASVAIVTRSLIDDDDDEEEEDLAQLTRRHSRAESRTSQSKSTGTNESLLPIDDTIVATSYEPTTSVTDDLCKALALPSDSSADQVKNTKEQDMIDLLSLSLSTSSPSPHSSPPAIHQNMHHQVQGYPYIVPWAQPQSQPQVQPQFRSQFQAEYQSQNQSSSLFIGQPQSQTQTQSQSYLQPQYPQNSSGYHLPQWATSPGYFTGRKQFSSANDMFLAQKSNASSSNPMIGSRPLQHSNSFPMIGSSGTRMNGDHLAAPVAAQNPYVPPYRLFEDLNVLGNGDGRLKMKSSTSTHSLFGGRK